MDDIIAYLCTTKSINAVTRCKAGGKIIKLKTSGKNEQT